MQNKPVLIFQGTRNLKKKAELPPNFNFNDFIYIFFYKPGLIYAGYSEINQVCFWRAREISQNLSCHPIFILFLFYFMFKLA